MIIDENETRILNRLQDVELDMMRHGDYRQKMNHLKSQIEIF